MTNKNSNNFTQLVCVFVFIGRREGGREGGREGKGDQRRGIHKTCLNLLMLKEMDAEASHAKQSLATIVHWGRHKVIP